MATTGDLTILWGQKAVQAHLRDRGVTVKRMTVYRWRRLEHDPLPVKSRWANGRQRVFAYEEEIDAWLGRQMPPSPTFVPQ